ncbi:hypothetical protein V6N12_065628 [Hibiscus sabdariffa]|uniref:Uncharacterized protein n=1 Tax=Hibiscus sabdariffa TaxID=183260 RepID=A0ABR2G985_9ROSI
MKLTTNRIYVSRHVRIVSHIFHVATHQLLHVPWQSDVSLPIMSRQPTTSLPTMPQQPDLSLPTMPDDVIATSVPLADPPQQAVSPDLQQQDVSLDLP